MNMHKLVFAALAALVPTSAEAKLIDYHYFGTNTNGLYGIGYNAPFSGASVGLSLSKEGYGMVYANVPIGYGGHVDGWYDVEEFVQGNVHTFKGGMVDSL